MVAEAHLEAMRRDGYCIIEGAFPAEYCDRAVDILRGVAAGQGMRIANDAPPGQRTLRLSNVLQYDDMFQELPVHETVLAVMHGYLDKECLLSGIDSIEIHPGEVEQALHTDSWWHDDRRLDFPICVNSALALVDFTKANGATQLVPGSHVWPEERIRGTGFFRSPDDKPQGYGSEWLPVTAEAPKGSIVLWDARLLHAGGANVTDEPRPSIISPYVAGWVRQLDNFAYAIPPEKARTYPRQLQQLIGLDCYRGIYGHINNMSPRDFLWGKQAEPA
jgi:ectoine hydroxylase-related dioxygenase (phytanoyl-CoA dioxygenase family)